ncbi:MAG TPA: hypothetical protein VNZ52_11160 [Candidatus Thermoplasmatota archaeon]|nr:hypothetical protein [Candidatus Thermoplasmatota archaeon]
MSSLRSAVTPQKTPSPAEGKSTRRQRALAWFFVTILLVSALGGLAYLLTAQ